jgi:succinoglycan biosynthesis transport protein ExoP
MEKLYSQPSSSDLNGKSAPQLLQAQPFVMWSEQQVDDWTARDFLSIIRRRALIIAGVAVTVMAGVCSITFSQQAEYQGNFQLLVEPVNSDDASLSNLTVTVNPNLGRAGLDYETQIQVLKSPELMSTIVNKLRASYPDISYASIINNLTIARLGQTKMIEVRYRSSDPKKIKVVLQQLADAYLKYSLEKRETKLRQGILFLEQQLPSIKNRVDRLQQNLQIFRQQNNFIDPDTQIQQITSQVETFTEQRLALAQKLAMAHANFKSLQEEPGALAALNDAPVYQELIRHQRELETQIITELVRFQEDSPPILSLKEKREKLLPLLRKEAQRVLNAKLAQAVAEIQNIEMQSQEISSRELQLKQRQNQLPILARRYTELQQELHIASESLNRFLATRENLQIQIAQTEIPWQVIQAPTEPENAISPNIQRNLLLGLIASALLGISSALLFEKLDNTYHTLDSLQEKVKLPLLGTIPFEKGISNVKKGASKGKQSTSTATPLESISRGIPGLVAIEDAQFNDSISNKNNDSRRFLEAFRVLHTNIQLLSSDSPIRSIVITSALPEDGKSTVAYHLAEIAASMGQRVLLVDADLRRSQVHSLLCFNNSLSFNNLWGLSSLISTNIPEQEIIQQLPSMNKFSVLTAGPIPPDAAKLLSSQKMKRLMANFREVFDLVIYDAPPLLGLADASLLAPQTDGIVLVARMEKTDKSALKQTLDNLRMSRINILGVVANGHRSNLHRYENYYY